MKINMLDKLKYFAASNDLEVENVNTKYAKLLFEGKVINFVDKDTGDILKKRSKDIPSAKKMGNINNMEIWRIVKSTGKFLNGIICGPVTVGRNVILNSKDYTEKNVHNTDHVIVVDNKTLRLVNSNFSLVIRLEE
jgi:hypothetical protein